MQNKNLLLINLFEYLNINVCYAVLRNYENLPYNNLSRDIDIIIEKKELNKHKYSIYDIIIGSGWKIITYLNNGRLITYVCGFIQNSNVELIQLDFFLHTSVHGITLADSNEFIKNREFNGNIYHVSKDYEFLDKYLYNRAVGACYPEKYHSLRKSVEQREFVKNKIKTIFGSADLKYIDKQPGTKLLVQALLKNLQTNFLRTIYRISESFYLYWFNYLQSEIALQIGFTGPDGSGKTTVIELFYKKTSAVFGNATEFYHFRPSLFPNISDSLSSAGLKKKIDNEYNIPHRGSKKGKINSLARLIYYSFDYIFGFWMKVKPQCCLTRLVIFDRYYPDIVADSRRSSIYLKPKFLFYWGKFFIPSLDYNFLLTADTEIILKRKQELDKDSIEKINSCLKYLSEKKDYYLIKNDGTPDEAVEKLLEIIFNKQHKKNLKRLGYDDK